MLVLHKNWLLVLSHSTSTDCKILHGHRFIWVFSFFDLMQAYIFAAVGRHIFIVAQKYVE